MCIWALSIAQCRRGDVAAACNNNAPLISGHMFFPTANETLRPADYIPTPPH